MSPVVLRDRGEERRVHVTNTELFFDLVYVFAFTQVSELLYSDLTLRGGLETLVLFLAIWWGWNYTAWATGWINPESAPVVLLMAVLMGLSLAMSAAVVSAFGDRGKTFAIAYVALQLTRSTFMVWALRDQPMMRRNYAQLLAWSAITGVIWILGAFVKSADARLVIWAVAAILDLSAPMHGFRLPGIPPTAMRDWSVAGRHLAERCQLMLLVAFGETMLRMGEAFAHEHGTLAHSTAFVIGFILVVALWALYYLHHAPAQQETIVTAADEVAKLSRTALTYAHALMVAAVIIVAVAANKAIEVPTHHGSLEFDVLCLGGPALFLFGMALGKRWLGHGRMLPPVVGVIGLAALGIPGSFDERLTTLTAATCVTVAMAIWAVRFS